MSRVAALLLALVVMSALAVVSLQYRSRKLVTAEEREKTHARALEAEWTQLQLENSTWAAPGRVEKIARDRLGMRVPTKDNQLSLDVVGSENSSQKGAANQPVKP